MSHTSELGNVLAYADPNLLSYVDRGLAAKAENHMFSGSVTSAKQLVTAGFCSLQVEKGSEKLKTAFTVEKQKELRDWLTIVIKASEFKAPILLPGDQYLSVQAGEKGREILLTGTPGTRLICLIEGEGDKARFEVNLAGATLYGTQLLEHAFVGEERTYVYKQYLPERAILASIGIAA